ncbi:MAG TPA: ABC transporter permease [Sandaracinaceae bacterium LLY-WYZ-13_1]|nr:ABC transporter permease [Sandaracinaceae bacterium LLY-WYZ-13_1]
MIELVLRRTVAGVVIVVLALSAIFMVANGIGDPAVATLGANAHPDQLQAFREEHGLDEPLAVQYGRYLGGLVTGDLGRSFRDDQPVTRVILQRLPRTLLLSGMALSFQIFIGLLLGTLAALRRGTLLDTGFMGMAFLGISIPSFVSGPILLMVMAFRMGWFPIGGYGVGFWGHVYHALLPAAVMAVIGTATYARVMRSEMIEVMGADFIRTARAKGLHPVQVVLSHGVRNALLPIVTLMGLSLPVLVNGAIITEAIFNWPGMGRLAIESIHSLDVPMIMGVVLFAAITVQIGNLLADVAVGALDPRVRLGK